MQVFLVHSIIPSLMAHIALLSRAEKATHCLGDQHLVFAVICIIKVSTLPREWTEGVVGRGGGDKVGFSL